MPTHHPIHCERAGDDGGQLVRGSVLLLPSGKARAEQRWKSELGEEPEDLCLQSSPAEMLQLLAAAGMGARSLAVVGL